MVGVPLRTCGSLGPLVSMTLLGTLPPYLRVPQGSSFYSLPAGDSLLPGHVCPPPIQHRSGQVTEGPVTPSPLGPTHQNLFSVLSPPLSTQSEKQVALS